jgi:signal transduction histidine kinase
MENAIEINLIKFVFFGSILMFVLVSGFILLFIAFKKRIQREQESLRTAEVNFERQISEAAIQAEQQERVQIAMDLHDEIGALVTVLKINILNAQNRMDQPERLFGLLNETSEVIEKTADTIRRISNRISPPTLVKMGLDTTLIELVKTIQATGKMTINYQSNLNGIRFRLDAELNMYRIIIEMLNNVLKHSHTDQLDLDVMRSNENLKITFNYVGIGLNNAQVQLLLRQEKGSGLKSIQSRINHFKGSINYQVDQKGKAEILIKIPSDEIRN